MVYEPLAPIAEATDSQKHFVGLTTVMVDHYIAARFEECLAAADRVDEAFGPSKLTALYRKPCQLYLREPPEAFEGQIVLEGK
jgi:hypothetical protein